MTTVYTHNLALGVGVGVLLSALFFAYKVSRLVDIRSELSASKKERTYTVYGQLFLFPPAALPIASISRRS